MSKYKGLDDYDDLNEEDFLNNTKSSGSDDTDDISTDVPESPADVKNDRYTDYGEVYDDADSFEEEGRSRYKSSEDDYDDWDKDYEDDYDDWDKSSGDDYDEPKRPGKSSGNVKKRVESIFKSGSGRKRTRKKGNDEDLPEDEDYQDIYDTDGLEPDLDDVGGYDDEYFDDASLEEDINESRSRRSGSSIRQRRAGSIKKTSTVDDFREWLSDNLRYFMLGGGVLLLILIVVFAVKGCSGRNTSDIEVAPDTVTNVVDTGAASQGTESETIANPLVKAESGIVSLVNERFKAMADGDTDKVRSLQTDLSAVDEAKIVNDSQIVESYTTKDVYTKTGREDGSYVTYVSYDAKYNDYDTAVPRLEELYVITTGDKNLIVDSDALTDPDISAYMNQLRQDQDVQQLISSVKSEEEAVLASDPQIASFLAGMGEAVSAPVSGTDTGADTSAEGGDAAQAAPEGPSMTVTADAVNLRSQPGGDEIIDVIQYGSPVTVLGTAGENNDWYQVQYNGQTGYVYSEFLSN